MRIVFVTPYFYPAWQYGGTPKAAYELARALSKRGHELTILTTDSLGASRVKLDEKQSRVQKVEGLTVHYYPNVSNFLAFRHRIFLPTGLKKELPAILKNADLVHIHEFRSTLTVAAFQAARKARVPYVVAPHGGLKYLGKGLPKRVFDSMWGRDILANASAVMVVSDIEKNDATTMFQVTPGQIEVLLNPIDIGEFSELPAADRFKSEWGIRGMFALFLGRLHWVKGADLLIRALAEIKQSCDMRFVFAGPDDGQKAELMRLIREHGLMDDVIFTGYLNGPKRVAALAAADLTIVPSRSEVFSITAVESLLSGTPVVVSSCCGLPKALDEQAGVVRFTNEDVSSLALAVTQAVKNKGLTANCAVARQIIEGTLSAERIAEQAESIYSRVIMTASDIP